MMMFMPSAVRVTLANNSDLPAPMACAPKIDAAMAIDRAGN